jgi:hypothetical protein
MRTAIFTELAVQGNAAICPLDGHKWQAVFTQNKASRLNIASHYDKFSYHGVGRGERFHRGDFWPRAAQLFP